MPITPITVSASGNSGSITLSAQNLPAGLTFTDNGDGTGTITGTLAGGTAADSPYPVVVTATDTSGQEDSEVITVLVNPHPREPYDVGVADPTSPVLVTSGHTPDAGVSYWVNGRVVGVDLVAMMGVGYTPSIYLVDVSNPASPSLVSQFVPEHVPGSHVSGGVGQAFETVITPDYPNKRIWVGNRGGLALYDISNPAAPTRVNGVAQGYWHGLEFNGTHLVGQQGPNTDIYFLDPDTLDVVDSFAPSNREALLCVSKHLFTVSSNVVRRFDVTALPPVQTAHYSFSNGYANSIRAMTYLPSTTGGPVAIVWMDSANSGYSVLGALDADIADGTTNEGVVNSVATALGTNVTSISGQPAPPRHSIVSDVNNIVYLAARSGSNTITVYDFSNPAAPQKVATTTVDTFYAGIGVTNGKLVVVHHGGLSIWT